MERPQEQTRHFDGRGRGRPSKRRRGEDLDEPQDGEAWDEPDAAGCDPSDVDEGIASQRVDEGYASERGDGEPDRPHSDAESDAGVWQHLGLDGREEGVEDAAPGDRSRRPAWEPTWPDDDEAPAEDGGRPARRGRSESQPGEEAAPTEGRPQKKSKKAKKQERQPALSSANTVKLGSFSRSLVRPTPRVDRRARDFPGGEDREHDRPDGDVAERGRDYEAERGQGNSFTVRLSRVPQGYDHAELVALHRHCGLGAKSLQSSRDCELQGHSVKTVILRYRSHEAAQRAERALHGQQVKGNTSRKGGKGKKVWILQAELVAERERGVKRKREDAGPEVIYPSVYISDIPVNYGQEKLEEIHAEIGVPIDSLMGVKFLTPQERSGETRACILRYLDDETVQKAISGLDGMKVYTVSGSTRFLGARAARPARWMAERGVALEVPEEEPPPDIPAAVEDFAARFDLDRSTVVFLARLPEKIQTIVVERFVQMPGEEAAVNGKVRAFAMSCQKHLVDDLEVGVPLSGTCKVWHEERGFGFVVPEGGGPDIFVHRRSLRDGEKLEAQLKVTFKVDWDEDKLKYVASDCYGALEGPGDEDKLFVSGLPVSDPSLFVKELFGQFGTVTLVKLLPANGYADRAALVRMSTSKEAREVEANLSRTMPEGAAACLTIRPAGKKRPALGQEAFASGRDADYVEVLEEPFQLHLKGSGVVKSWDGESSEGLVVPDMESHDVLVRQTALADGKLLIVGTEVSFEADWDEGRRQYVAATCTGARNHEEQMPQPSRQLEAFAARNGLEPYFTSWLARLPEAVVGCAMQKFSPRFGATLQHRKFLARNLRTFTKSLQERLRSRPPPPPARPRVEPSAELQAFGQEWELDGATVTWLAGLPLVVQTAAMQKFRGAGGEEGGGKGSAEPEPSDRLLVTGLPADVQEETVRQIFGDYAYVTHCKIVRGSKPGRAAIVRVVDVDQASLCIAGLDQTTPDGMKSPITVRFADKEVEQASDSLHVTGLPVENPEEFLTRLFSQHGTVAHCELLPDTNGPDRGALVRMADAEQARRCVDAYDQHIPAGGLLPLEVWYSQDEREDKSKATAEAIREFVRSLSLRLEPPAALRAPRRILPNASPVSQEAGGTTPSAASSSAPAEAAGAASDEPVLMAARVKDWQDLNQLGHVCPDGGLPEVLVRRSLLEGANSLRPGMYVLVDATWDGKEEKFAAKTCMVMHLYLAGLAPDTSEAAVGELLAPFGGVLHCHLLPLNRMGAPAAAGGAEGSRAALVRMSGGDAEAKSAVDGLRGKGSLSACLAEQRAVVVPPPPPLPRQHQHRPAHPSQPPPPSHPPPLPSLQWRQPAVRPPAMRPPAAAFPVLPPAAAALGTRPPLPVPPAPPRRAAAVVQPPPPPATPPKLQAAPSSSRSAVEAPPPAPALACSPFEEAEMEAKAKELDPPAQDDPHQVWEWNGQTPAPPPPDDVEAWDEVAVGDAEDQEWQDEEGAEEGAEEEWHDQDENEPEAYAGSSSRPPVAKWGQPPRPSKAPAYGDEDEEYVDVLEEEP